MMLIDIVGKKFGRLTVLRRVKKTFVGGGARYVVRCECGDERVVRSQRLRDAETVGCRACSHKTHGMSGTWEHSLYASAKQRAKKLGLPFNITPQDIFIPTRCPILGMRLRRHIGSLSKDSASLDRIVSARGYVRGNVWVISHKANSAKSDLTLAELRRLVAALEAH